MRSLAVPRVCPDVLSDVHAMIERPRQLGEPT